MTSATLDVVSDVMFIHEVVSRTSADRPQALLTRRHRRRPIAGRHVAHRVLDWVSRRRRAAQRFCQQFLLTAASRIDCRLVQSTGCAGDHAARAILVDKAVIHCGDTHLHTCTPADVATMLMAAGWLALCPAGCPAGGRTADSSQLLCRSAALSVRTSSSAAGAESATASKGLGSHPDELGALSPVVRLLPSVPSPQAAAECSPVRLFKTASAALLNVTLRAGDAGLMGLAQAGAASCDLLGVGGPEPGLRLRRRPADGCRGNSPSPSPSQP